MAVIQALETYGLEKLDELAAWLADAPLVLLGEATHGTHEFYQLRADLTRRLIADHGFQAVAAEADWPDAFRVNRYVRGLSDDASAEQALGDFRRFPAWMWRNTEVVEFVQWLREHNRAGGQAGFYGLDLYSMHGSIQAVLAHLDRTDIQAARRARERYSCFDQFGRDPRDYAYATALNLADDCRSEVLAQLLDMRRRRGVGEEAFSAEQNARLVRDAEAYYRAMLGGEPSSWNLRDTHMADTLDALLEHLRPGRVVVWAHNSHVGDARATSMGSGGELNIGQLARQRHGGRARLVGFCTHRGTVTAASSWDGPAERKRVRPGLPDSYEDALSKLDRERFFFRTSGLDPSENRLERAIGVLYLPQTERQSHYFRACLASQFDALVHCDQTRALEPLERTLQWDRGELPETYPSGF